MKIITPYRMFLFIMLWFISCGTSHKVVDKPIQPKVILEAMPVVPVRTDTIKLKPSPEVLEHDVHVMSSIKQNSLYSDINDTLFKRNLELQRITVRVIDRAREMRMQKDSALMMLRGIRDTVNNTKAVFKSAKEDHKIIETSHRWYDKIILFCLIICTTGTLAGWAKPYLQRKYIR